MNSKKQIQKLARQAILNKSIENLVLIKSKSFKDAVTLINECAPEHLILLDEDYSKYLININNAGSIFCGSLSPESFGDYSSGSNHVLPTNGQAKVHSGLGVSDFGKQISVQTASPEGFNNLKDTVINMAQAETLDAHENAVKIRESLASHLESSRMFTEIRKTNETSIYINLNLDGTGNFNIKTGLNYLDHLLEQFSKHGSIDLNLTCLGDLEIDEHHTVEDIAIALGTAINNALGDRVGISRYASSEILVMDEVKCNVSIDLSSRRYLDFKCSQLRDYVGDFPTEMFEHFFVSLINAAAMTCHIETNGKNSHHLLEATFKTFARCLKSAIVVESIKTSSTKGIIMTVAIVDCGGANLRSVQRAVELQNMKSIITNDKGKVSSASFVILPTRVGSANSVMQSLKSNNLLDTVKNLTSPVLGICIGMHVLFDQSDENNTECMGIISGNIKKI